MKDALHVLVVDDDRNVCQLLRLYLEKEGYSVAEAQRGDSALDEFRRQTPDIIVLDVMLPGLDGWGVLREVRKTSQVPIIMLTAKGETFDKVLGLELGADDYMTKPFDAKELLARIKAVIRRTQPQDESDNVVEYPLLRVCLADYTVTYRGQKMELPPKETELLYFLASHPNKVFTREQLLEQVWNFNYFGDSRTVDVHVKRLREKLQREDNPWEIRTVRTVGYKFEVKQA